MTSADEFKTRVARIALKASAAHGFALAGGNALAAHGIIDRPTEDVDLFAPEPGAVQAAAGLVAAALTEAGLSVTVTRAATDLAEIFEGFELDKIQYEVAGDGYVVRLELVRFDRSRPAVTMDIGLVLHRDDVLGSKVAAMATRAEPRDFADVAAALASHDRTELIELAHRADPDLVDEEFAGAMRQLDRLDDAVFGQYRLSAGQVRGIRAAFAAWPRLADPQAGSRDT